MLVPYSRATGMLPLKEPEHMHRDPAGTEIPMTPQARRNRLILVTVTLAAVLGLLVVARGALFPFVLSAALAYVLNPVVKTFESRMPWRNRWPGLSRIAAILVIYIGAIAVLVGAFAIIIPPAFRQASEFVDEVPGLIAQARTTVEGWNEQYSERIPEDVREQIEGSLKSGSSILISAARTVVGKTIGAVTNTVTIVIGLAVVPFMLFYLLKDREAAVEGFYSLLPADARRHMTNVVAIINRVVGAYVRAQLTLAVVVGVLAFLGLFVLGIKFSVLLGIVAGVSELVPVVGPLLGAIPGILVALATSPGDIVWVIALYVAIQLVENALLVPRIQGEAVDIHPALIMLVLIIGSEAAGLFGVILAVPAAAVARDIFRYFHSEWSAQPGPAEPAPETPISETATGSAPEADGPDPQPKA